MKRTVIFIAVVLLLSGCTGNKLARKWEGRKKQFNDFQKNPHVLYGTYHITESSIPNVKKYYQIEPSLSRKSSIVLNPDRTFNVFNYPDGTIVGNAINDNGKWKLWWSHPSPSLSITWDPGPTGRKAYGNWNVYLVKGKVEIVIYADIESPDKISYIKDNGAQQQEK